MCAAGHDYGYALVLLVFMGWNMVVIEVGGERGHYFRVCIECERPVGRGCCRQASASMSRCRSVTLLCFTRLLVI